MKSGIYVIVNLVTLQKYVGQSVDISKRWKSHWSEARRERASANTRLYNAMRKYGQEAFAILTLELCEVARLDEREVHWIAAFDSVNRGYNLMVGGRGLGPRVLSEETRKRMSDAQKGKPPPSAETRAKISAANTGSTHTSETRAKLSQALKGRTFTQETKARMSISQMGRPAWNKGLACGPMSDAARQRMSASGAGKPKSPEHREKLRAALAKARAVLLAQRQVAASAP
jgi:group I intron endonuclease